VSLNNQRLDQYGKSFVQLFSTEGYRSRLFSTCE